VTAVAAAALSAPASAPAVPATPAAATAIERSVVRLVNYAQRGDWALPWQEGQVVASSGSGFVIAGKVVMTNAHVVSDSRLLLLYLHDDPAPHQARVRSIGHDCDLALVEPVEPGLLDGIPPLAFGGLPALRASVDTFGYPAGGSQLSSTRGVVSRIEDGLYSHSGIDAHLVGQTDAAINPGNSGGPVLLDGRVVGVAFQAAAGLENVGYFIPGEVVERFLRDVADGRYDGYPELGVQTAEMDNPAARREAGMEPGETGVRVDEVWPASSADGRLAVGDVLLAVAGRPVANDGSVAVDGLRLPFGLLADRMQVGQPVAITVRRDGHRLEVSVPLAAYPGLEWQRNAYDRLPRYLVYAGLVFVPLEREVLETYGRDWRASADLDLQYEYFLRHLAEPEVLRRERLVLLARLDHPVNAGLAGLRNEVVERVNGRRIDRLEDLVEALESNRTAFHVIETSSPGGMGVLDRVEADRAHPEILRQYGVTRDRRP
jgi:S1-C subfamily serine protease